MKLGLRTIKTGIAVSITMLVSMLLNIQPFFAMVAALIAMQPTVSDSWQAGLNRLLGTFFGAIVGVVFVVIVPPNFIMVAIGLIILIHVMNYLKWNDSINIASVVFIAITLNHDEGHISYALSRLFDTFIGISIALMVNYLVYPPTYDRKVLNEIRNTIKHVWSSLIKIIDAIIDDEDHLLSFQYLIEEIAKEIETSEKFLSMQHKEEKMKVYGEISYQDIYNKLKLTKEIHQHLKNLLGIMEKGISKDVIKFIVVELKEIRGNIVDLEVIDTKLLSRDVDCNLQPALKLIRQAKEGFKRNQKVNEYPSDEIIKLMVIIYNMEEILFKLSFLKGC